MEPHPIRLVVEDDLRRSRLTVFLRIILAIPHLIWIGLWSIAMVVVAVVNWFAVVFTGRLPAGLHRFAAAYVRYTTHLNAYLYLAANPYPGFLGAAGSYPIDAVIEEPGRQSRWKAGFRIFLALPALLLMSTLVGFGAGGGGGGGGGGGRTADTDVGSEAAWTAGGTLSAVVVAAILGWFVCVARGSMPLGFRDLAAYGLRYAAQTFGYLLLLTDRYPNADPGEPPATQPTPAKPVRIRVEDDLRRSRLTVFFRLLLAIPHVVWLILWGILVVLALIVGWFATLATGRLPDAFHRFFSAYLRYETHVFAFLLLVANPFPGFVGAAGSYPVDVEIAPPEAQNRWKTLFRIFLAIPAALLNSALGGALYVAAFLGWFVSLALGRMPEGLRNLGAYVLRYSAQLYAYLYLLTDSYPYSGPVAYVEREVELEPVPTWPDAPPEPSF
ncbi:MAG TPA: DUF4389 domain-containing protein [Gaiellaceae bacterium]|nr:DUF4389 domain-containing protein [Gaiellaceae bacterium]